MRWGMLQRANTKTNFFLKISLLQKTRGKTIGRCSKREHMKCRAFPPWLER